MNMKQRLAFFGGGLVLSAISSIALAADATDTAEISATVLTPISITKTADLNFGSFAADSDQAGTVVVATNGGRSFTGGADAISTDASAVTAASFNVAGEGTATFSITVPTSDVTLTRATGSETMTVATFVSDPLGTGTLVDGAKLVSVGATLSVGAGQMAGTYVNASGLPVTVAYN